MKRTARAKARWHITPEVLARCTDPLSCPVASPSRPVPGPRLVGVMEVDAAAVAPRLPGAIRAGLKGQTYRRRYANTHAPVVYTRAPA